MALIRHVDRLHVGEVACGQRFRGFVAAVAAQVADGVGQGLELVGQDALAGDIRPWLTCTTSPEQISAFRIPLATCACAADVPAVMVPSGVVVVPEICLMTWVLLAADVPDVVT